MHNYKYLENNVRGEHKKLLLLGAATVKSAKKYFLLFPPVLFLHFCGKICPKNDVFPSHIKNLASKYFSLNEK